MARFCSEGEIMSEHRTIDEDVEALDAATREPITDALRNLEAEIASTVKPPALTEDASKTFAPSATKRVPIEAAGDLSTDAIAKGFETCCRDVDAATVSYEQAIGGVMSTLRDVLEVLSKSVDTERTYAERRKEWLRGRSADCVTAIEMAVAAAKRIAQLHRDSMGSTE